jgi:hypothetical protein
MTEPRDVGPCCERTIELLFDRLKGLSTAEDERRLDAHLAACAACLEETEAITELWSDMGALDRDPVPRERMRARFHAALAAHEERRRGNAVDRFLERLWPRRPALQMGIAAALLVLGLLIGQSLPSPMHAEIAGLRGEIRAVDAALLDHQSASERLRGIELARQIEPDERIVGLLLDAVRHDPSLNVRLAAVEALADRLDEPRVRAGLGDALSREQSPLMQVTLARVLLDGKVEGSPNDVLRLLEREDLDPSVRDYLRTALRGSGAGERGAVKPLAGRREVL